MHTVARWLSCAIRNGFLSRNCTCWIWEEIEHRTVCNFGSATLRTCTESRRPKQSGWRGGKLKIYRRSGSFMRCCISENETISSLIEKCFEMRRRERRMKSIENETADDGVESCESAWTKIPFSAPQKLSSLLLLGAICNMKIKCWLDTPVKHEEENFPSACDSARKCSSFQRLRGEDEGKQRV